MENSIAIKEINLVNFKGLKSETIKFNHVTNIFGDNGVGKTTIFDAFTWLLFGKDSTDRKDFEIKTLDKNNIVIPKIDHEVSAVIDVNGEEILIKRVYREKWVKKRGSLNSEFSGNETIYYWNEVPKSQREFQDKIASILNESVFKMITNPLAFNGMKWQDKRNALIEIVGNISDLEIAGTNKDFVLLLNKLSNKSIEEYKKQLAAQRKKMNDEIKFIPTRIDEVSKNTPAALDFVSLRANKTTLQKSIENIQSQIDDKSKAYDAIILKRQEASNEIFSLKSKLQNIEFETTSKLQRETKTDDSELVNLRKDLENKNLELKTTDNGINSLTLEINALEEKIISFDKKIISKREEWNLENAKELSFDDNSFDCPTCKRAFEAQDIQNKKEQLVHDFTTKRNDNLIEINKQGKSLAEQKTAVEASIFTLKERIKKGEDLSKQLNLDIINIETNIENASKNKVSETPLEDFSRLVENALLENAEYQNIKKEITVKEVANTTINPVNVDDLKQQRASVETQIKSIDTQLAIEGQIEASTKRVAELEKQEQTLAQQISDLEREQFTIENFIKKKIDTLESMINKKFNYVKFKLFETQINGADVECCHALIDGVPFSDANTASKINAGLDIINTLCEFYKITAPIFIDNRESIVNIIDCKSQIVNLIVSKADAKLRVA
jgi:DNA repair exonuclease SbcCD ATPase subunit